MSATTDNPIITAAAVAVPREILRRLRGIVRRRVPEKWKRGRLDGLQVVADLIVSSRLPAAVCQLHVADRAVWASYFNDGHQFVIDAAKKERQSMSHFDPEVVLKMELLSRSCMRLLGGLFRSRQSDAAVHTIEVEFVADTDLRTHESEELFCQSMLGWPAATVVREAIGLHPIVRDTRCETEQAEPLLMLADYLAGVYQHEDPRTKLGAPIVSPQEAADAVHDLRQRVQAGQLFEERFDFSDKYLLAHDAEGRVIQVDPEGLE